MYDFVLISLNVSIKSTIRTSKGEHEVRFGSIRDLFDGTAVKRLPSLVSSTIIEIQEITK